MCNNLLSVTGTTTKPRSPCIDILAEMHLCIRQHRTNIQLYDSRDDDNRLIESLFALYNAIVQVYSAALDRSSRMAATSRGTIALIKWRLFQKHNRHSDQPRSTQPKQTKGSITYDSSRTRFRTGRSQPWLAIASASFPSLMLGSKRSRSANDKWRSNTSNNDRRIQMAYSSLR